MTKRRKQLVLLSALVTVLIVGMVAQRGRRIITRTQRPTGGDHGELAGTALYQCDSQPATERTLYIYRFYESNPLSFAPAEPTRDDGSFRIQGLAAGTLQLFISSRSDVPGFTGPGTAVEVKSGSVTRQDLFVLTCPNVQLVSPSWDEELRTTRPEFRWAFDREDVQYEVEVTGPGPLHRFRSVHTSVTASEDLAPGIHRWHVRVLSAEHRLLGRSSAVPFRIVEH
jgi:hypothetical protein